MITCDQLTLRGQFELVGEIESAFSCDDHEFLAHYGFLKPSKSSSSVVVASRNGRRAAVAIEKFKKIGYNSFKYVTHRQPIGLSVD